MVRGRRWLGVQCDQTLINPLLVLCWSLLSWNPHTSVQYHLDYADPQIRAMDGDFKEGGKQSFLLIELSNRLLRNCQSATVVSTGFGRSLSHVLPSAVVVLLSWSPALCQHFSWVLIQERWAWSQTHHQDSCQSLRADCIWCLLWWPQDVTKMVRPLLYMTLVLVTINSMVDKTQHYQLCAYLGEPLAQCCGVSISFGCYV